VDKTYERFFYFVFMKYEELVREIIRIFYKVYNRLGYGFLEKVYENAMKIELEKSGIKFSNQFPVKVFYDGQVVGDYVADFIVDGKIVVELKAISNISMKDSNQLLNYLSATSKVVGLLLNFGERPIFRIREK